MIYFFTHKIAKDGISYNNILQLKFYINNQEIDEIIMVKSINNLKLKMEFGLALVLRASKNQNFFAKLF